MKLRPDAFRPRDWFEADGFPVRLVGVPGWSTTGRGHTMIPRNLLRLIEDIPAAASTLAALNVGQRETWLDRDKRDATKGFKLRTTQQQAIDFIQRRRGTLLGDDMRLGKTLSALRSHELSDGQLIIVGPLSSRAVWLGWIKRAFPELSANEIGVCVGRKLDRAVMDKPVVFVHYDIVFQWNTIRKFGTVVFDEAHMLGSSKTRRTKGAATLASQANRVIALTGTPIWNMPEDLWSLISILAPGAWGNFYDFAQRYAAPESTAYGTRYTGSSNEAELNARLSEVMLRRRWIDCCDDLPAISRSVVVADIDQATSNKLDVLAAKLRTERANTAGLLSSYRQLVSASKLKCVVEQACKVTSRNEPVVVWTWHKDFANKIADAIASPEQRVFVIHGDISPTRRDEIIEAWRQWPNGVLIATMSVGQVAIDLSHAHICIFGEIDWTPAVIAQTEMRVFMLGRPMDVLFVIASHIVEQRVVRALIAKLGAQTSLGVGAACESIDALRGAVFGQEDVGDLDRLFETMLEAA